jgi:hypothetical protein
LDVAGLVAKGVLGLATTGALLMARKRAAERAADEADTGDVPEPYWCYVMASTAVYPLSGQEEIVGYLSPGNWYLARATYDEWVHVRDDDAGLEGFAARSAINPAEATGDQ